MEYRYKIKINNERGRKDKRGSIINFLLSLEDYIRIFLPYKEDHRLYLKNNDKNRLCLCRYDDIGDYTMGNIYIETRSQNSKSALCLPNKGALNLTDPTIRIKALLMGKIRLKELYPNGTFKDRKHKESTKKLIGEKTSISQQGEKNSRYGTCWIYNLAEKINRSIPKEDLQFWIEQGWIKGRKMEF